MRKLFFTFCLLFYAVFSTVAQPQHSLGAIMSGTNEILGTGFVIHDSSTILTCYHLIKDKTKIIYQPADRNDFYIVKVVKIDTAQNIALLKAGVAIGVPLHGAFDDSITLGQRLQYFGYDRYEGSEGDAVIRVGYARIGAIGQLLEHRQAVNFIEFRAQDIPGYEGSPVINQAGDVIAITMVANTTQGIRSNRKNLVNRAYRVKPIW